MLAHLDIQKSEIYPWGSYCLYFYFEINWCVSIKSDSNGVSDINVIYIYYFIFIIILTLREVKKHEISQRSGFIRGWDGLSRSDKEQRDSTLELDCFIS